LWDLAEVEADPEDRVEVGAMAATVFKTGSDRLSPGICIDVERL
jgi:hypothetical protein